MSVCCLKILIFSNGLHCLIKTLLFFLFCCCCDFVFVFLCLFVFVFVLLFVCFFYFVVCFVLFDLILFKMSAVSFVSDCVYYNFSIMSISLLFFSYEY